MKGERSVSSGPIELVFDWTLSFKCRLVHELLLPGDIDLKRNVVFRGQRRSYVETPGVQTGSGVSLG